MASTARPFGSLTRRACGVSTVGSAPAGGCLVQSAMPDVANEACGGAARLGLAAFGFATGGCALAADGCAIASAATSHPHSAVRTRRITVSPAALRLD